MFGFININKPFGITSRDVVNRVERLVRPVKAGHSGTLDPIATGVLVIGVGPATRLLEYVQQMPKAYRGTFLLGQYSETDDIEGKVSTNTRAPIPSKNDIEKILPQFTGVILQQPPQYSAIKVGGRRAYDIARSGKQVTLARREVTIYSIDIIHYEYPELSLEVKCSAGTYIRALGRDLAENLGTSAVMASLCRTAIGDFTIAQSRSMRSLEEESISRLLLSPNLGVEDLVQIDLSKEEAKEIFHGRKISIQQSHLANLNSHTIAAFYNRNLVALLRYQAPFDLIPRKVFNPDSFTIDANGKL